MKRKQEVIDLLNAIDDGYNQSRVGLGYPSSDRGEFEIEASFEDFPNLIKIGRTPRERLQVFMMCYMVNPGVHELTTWTIQELLKYIKETNEFYVRDLPIIRECVFAIFSD